MAQANGSQGKKVFLTTSTMVKLAVLGALAFLLTWVEIPVVLFLKLDPSNIPAMVGTLAFGPFAGIGIELVKMLLDMMKSQSAGVGQLANFLMGTAYVVPLGLLYARRKTLGGLIIGMGAGTVCMVVAACLLNYYVLVPFYATLYKMDIHKIVAMGTEVFGAVTDLKTLIFWIIAPFNLVKGMMLSVIGCLLYKPLLPVLRWKPAR